MKRNITLGIIAIVLLFGYFYWGSHSSPLEVLHPTVKFAIWAMVLGAISAISLPLGSMAGLAFKPGPTVTAGLTAFGGGALLAALSVELIAPTIMEIVGQIPSTVGDDVINKPHAIATMGSLIGGCIMGGIIFVSFDDILNSKGAYLRKVSTIITFKRARRLEHEGSEVAHIEEKKEEHGAPLAIWLGLLIDGIPESFVIGAGFLALLSAKLTHGADPSFNDLVPYTLIAGLFLSNFPEALSASVGMSKRGWNGAKILMMWMSLVIIVAVGAGFGYYLGAEIPHELEIGIEGLAAGAMLTMIAQTMIPEAVHIGGPQIAGLGTLIGYLSAIAFKLFE